MALFTHFYTQCCYKQPIFIPVFLYLESINLKFALFMSTYANWFTVWPLCATSQWELNLMNNSSSLKLLLYLSISSCWKLILCCKSAPHVQRQTSVACFWHQVPKQPLPSHTVAPKWQVVEHLFSPWEGEEPADTQLRFYAVLAYSISSLSVPHNFFNKTLKDRGELSNLTAEEGPRHHLIIFQSFFS